MKVKVVAFKRHLIMMPQEALVGAKEWWPTGGNRLGCVIGNSLANLGVSKHALKLMQSIPVGGDCVGDIDWWWCEGGTYAFSWWGPIYRIINCDDSVSARGFKPREDQCTIIPNTVPIKAKRIINNKSEQAFWQEPLAIDK